MFRFCSSIICSFAPFVSYANFADLIISRKQSVETTCFTTRNIASHTETLL